MVFLGGDAVFDERGTPLQVTYGQIITLRHFPSGVCAHSQPQLLIRLCYERQLTIFVERVFNYAGRYAIPGPRKARCVGGYRDFVLGAITPVLWEGIAKG